MIRKKITVGDFEKVSNENEFFIWHFFNPNSVTQLNSIFLPENPFLPNPLIKILNLISVPYFESKSSESYDFLINLGNPFLENVYRYGVFNPVIVSFHKRRVVNHTFGPYCYCPEGIIELIGELNPQFLINTR